MSGNVVETLAAFAQRAIDETSDGLAVWVELHPLGLRLRGRRSGRDINHIVSWLEIEHVVSPDRLVDRSFKVLGMIKHD